MSDPSQYFFILTITALGLSFIGGMVVYFLKSKCRRISLCFGLIDVERDVEGEEKIEMNEINHGINPYPNIEIESKI